LTWAIKLYEPSLFAGLKAVVRCLVKGALALE